MFIAFPDLLNLSQQLFGIYTKKRSIAKKKELAKKMLILEIDFNLNIINHFLTDEKNTLSTKEAKLLSELIQHTTLELIYSDSDFSDIFDKCFIENNQNEDDATVSVMTKKTKVNAKSSSDVASFLLRKSAEAKALAKIDFALPKKIDWGKRYRNLKKSYLTLVKTIKK